MRSKRLSARANTVAEARINGVDLAALHAEIGAIRSQRSLGLFRFRADNRWLHGGHTRTTVKDFYGAGVQQTSRRRPIVVESELSAPFRGSDRAMFPLEQMLAALASCLTTTLVWRASVRGLHLDAVETRVEGDIDIAGLLGNDATVASGYRRIKVLVKLESDAPDAVLDDLLKVAKRFSPVFNSIRSCTTVTVTKIPAAS